MRKYRTRLPRSKYVLELDSVREQKTTFIPGCLAHSLAGRMEVFFVPQYQVIFPQKMLIFSCLNPFPLWFFRRTKKPCIHYWIGRGMSHFSIHIKHDTSGNGKYHEREENPGRPDKKKNLIQTKGQAYDSRKNKQNRWKKKKTISRSLMDCGIRKVCRRMIPSILHCEIQRT